MVGGLNVRSAPRQGQSGFPHANSKGLRGLRIGGLADCGLESSSWRFRGLGPPSRPAFVGRFAICTRNGAEFTPRELGGTF
eukprot:5399229-Alexandrium_andersonii.AAC.1